MSISKKAQWFPDALGIKTCLTCEHRVSQKKGKRSIHRCKIKNNIKIQKKQNACPLYKSKENKEK